MEILSKDSQLSGSMLVSISLTIIVGFFIYILLLGLAIPERKGKQVRWSPLQTLKMLIDTYTIQYDFITSLFNVDVNTLQMTIFGAKFINICWTRDPENVKHILKDNFDNYVKGSFFSDLFDEILGTGIFNSDGKAWMNQRKTASHMFTLNSFEDSMVPVFIHHSKSCLEEMERVAKINKGLVDVQSFAARYTFDSFGQIGFGVEIGSIQNPENPFITSFDRAQTHVLKRFSTPLPYFVQKLILPAEALFRKDILVLDQYVNDIVKQRRNEIQQCKVRNEDPELMFNDVLSRFIFLESFNDKELRDVVMNFIVAGRDTTACLISWACWRLTQHADIYAKVEKELEDASKGEISYSAIKNKLEYTTAFIYEVLRLHPSVPLDSKTVENDDVLPSGHILKKGSVVSYIIYAMGRNEEVWPDPLTFNPQRFVDEKKPNPFKFPVFNAGPRNCLGQQMAITECAIFLLHLLKKFKLSYDSNIQPNYKISVTLWMEKPLMIRLTPKA